MAELDQAAAPIYSADFGVVCHPRLPLFFPYLWCRVKAARHVSHGHSIQHLVAASLHLQQLLFLSTFLGRVNHNFARILSLG